MATQTNMPLQITGIEPGMLLDNFVLTNVVIFTNPPSIYVQQYVTTNASYLFHQRERRRRVLPARAIARTFKGVNAYGQWQLEVWDNRAGAGLTNTLVSWQLRFNFATNFSSVGIPHQPMAVTNVIPAGGIAYYLVIVPTNADFATNRLLFASGPLNVWFNPAILPVGTKSAGIPVDPQLKGGNSILSLTSMPTNIVPGGLISRLAKHRHLQHHLRNRVELPPGIPPRLIPPPSIGNASRQ